MNLDIYIHQRNHHRNQGNRHIFLHFYPVISLLLQKSKTEIINFLVDLALLPNFPVPSDVP